MKATQEFTMDMALAMQAAHLSLWKGRLREDLYAKLEKWALAGNGRARIPDEVLRGDDLTQWVLNH